VSQVGVHSGVVPPGHQFPPKRRNASLAAGTADLLGTNAGCRRRSWGTPGNPPSEYAFEPDHKLRSTNCGRPVCSDGDTTGGDRKV
jgi:hypothetical protein